MSHTASPRDAPCATGKRDWATADNRATQLCLNRISRAFCDLGARREHLPTRNAAQQRGPHSQAPEDRSDTHANHGMWHAAQRHRTRHARGIDTHGNTTRHRGRRASKMLANADGRAAVQCPRRTAATVCDLGAQRGQLRTWRGGATTRATSSRAGNRARCALSARCGMAHGKIASTAQRATPRPATIRNASHNKEKCVRRRQQPVCDLRTRHEHLRTWRGATMRAASSGETRSRGETTSDTQLEASRTATNRDGVGDGRERRWATADGRDARLCRQEVAETALRIWRVARASLDVVARRTSAGYNVGRRTTGARRSRNAQCGMARGTLAKRHAK